MRSVEAGSSARRILVARSLLILPFLLLAIRAAQLGVDDHAIDHGGKQKNRTLVLAPERGGIYDRNGAELALSIDAPSVFVNPAAIRDIPRTSQLLAQALDRERASIAPRLSAKRSYAFVSRWVSPAQAARVKALGLDGVGIVQEPRRTYPHGPMAGPILGFANIDGKGVRGLEQQMDDWLRGTALRLPVERDARGRLLVDVGHERWSTAGGDIALTLDAAFQADAEAALAEAVTTTRAHGGVAIALDPHSGDVLALAEAPGFDPNRFREYDYAATRARSFVDSSDPGSTLKTFLVAAAIEAGVVTPEDRFDCENGDFRVPGSTIHDSHPYEILSVAEILQVSSNIGATKIAFLLGRQAHSEALERFGFGRSTDSGFPGESAGLLRPWQRWRTLDHATIAFGQGVNTTAIQMAAATAAIANGGEWVQPRLVAARRVAEGPWQPTRIEPRRRAVSTETAATVRTMMERVVGPEGTARRASLRHVRVAGKTGTAQKLDRKTGRYADDRFMAWFIGIVPADDPQLVIVVGIDEPARPMHHGGTAAAPVFARLAASQLARYGIVTEPGPYEGEPDPSGSETEIQLALHASEHETVAASAAATTLAPRSGIRVEPSSPHQVSAPPTPDTLRPEPKPAPDERVAVEAEAPLSASPQTLEIAERRADPVPALAAVFEPTPPATAAKSTPKPGVRTRTVSDVANELAQIGERVLLPDFRGLTPAEVRQITARTALAVNISGHGRAVSQVPPAGTILEAKQALVVVYFEATDVADLGGDL